METNQLARISHQGIEGCHFGHKCLGQEELLPRRSASLMPTECNQESFRFRPLARGEAWGRFDAGGLLRREAVRIILRGDSGSCREELMAWGEAHQVAYVLGLAKNERLKAQLAEELEQAAEQYRQTRRGASLRSPHTRGEKAGLTLHFGFYTCLA